MPPVIVHKSEAYKYKPKQQMREKIKYRNGVSNLFDGRSLYLPKKQYYSQGEGLGDIINFVSENKDLIKDIAGTVGSVVDTVGKVGTTTVDIIKKIKELKQSGISQKAVEDVLRAKSKNEQNKDDVRESINGNGFFLINK